MTNSAPVSATRLRDLSPEQRRSGLAAWLGWMFDGLDMHLYTLVAVPFVAQLMHLSLTVAADKAAVDRHASLIQAAFLVGWALGGGFFGRIGDRLGRSRALCLTILTYAGFTGLSFFAETWWQLLICRFLAALGIGGEWAVGASLLSETWPRKWRPWIAAVLQTGVNVGVVLACAAGWLLKEQPYRVVFLVGILPALLVLWIRRAVPEPAEWHEAKAKANATTPGIADLFRGSVASVTWRVLAICGVSLTAHWTFMFWHQTHLRSLPEVASLSPGDRQTQATIALFLVMAGSIVGNFFAGWLAHLFGYRKAMVGLLAAYFACMAAAYSMTWSYDALRVWLVAIGVCQGVFGLFTMCLPPVFPTLLRTTGAGFCYNFGRIAAACGTVYFGIFTKLDDYRHALFYAALLFIPAAVLAMWLPEKEHVEAPISAAE